MATTGETRISAQPIRQRIQGLRHRLRGWLMIDGVARVLLIALLLAAGDMLLDRLFKMDVAQRAIMLSLMVGTLVWLLWRALIQPLFTRLSDDAIVLEVGRKSGDRQQNLISGWQFARAKALPAGVSSELVRAAVDAGNRHAQSLSLDAVLDRRGLARNRILLVVGLAGCALLGLGVVGNDFVKTWFNRNILLGNEQWPQATYLEIAGVVDGVLTIDRGANHDLTILVTEQSRIRDVAVDVEVESGTRRSSHAAEATGRLDGREHQLPLRNVTTEFRVRALGGDAVTPWAQIRLVEPIDVRTLRLTIRPPEYAGAPYELLGSGPHSVLRGSQLQVYVESSLPVAYGHLIWNESTGGSTGSSSADGRFPLSAADGAFHPTHFAAHLPEEASSPPLRGGRYSIELSDATGRKNLRPIAFEITIADDKPPKVAASLSGIGGLVVNRARVPISFTAIDRYGLTASDVRYQWKPPEESAEPKTGAACKRTLGPGDILWSENAQEYSYNGDEVLDLEPLGIQPGEVLRFTVNAADNHPGEAGIGQSREFLLRVVSEEELRSDLLRREIEQRALFQQERANQLQLQADLRALAASDAIERDPAERHQALIDLQNRQKHIGTNLYQIAQRFQDFLQEARNNRLDESEQEFADALANQNPGGVSLQARYADRIIRPIEELDAAEIYRAGQAMEHMRGLLGDKAAFTESARQTADLQETIIQRMDQILAAMEESQTYQEIVNQVIAIKRMEQSLLDAIKPKQNQSGQPNIFDKPKPPPSDQPPQPSNRTQDDGNAGVGN